jgi:hypothetical protein
MEARVGEERSKIDCCGFDTTEQPTTKEQLGLNNNFIDWAQLIRNIGIYHTTNHLLG